MNGYYEVDISVQSEGGTQMLAIMLYGLIYILIFNLTHHLTPIGIKVSKYIVFAVRYGTP